MDVDHLKFLMFITFTKSFLKVDINWIVGKEDDQEYNIS